VRSSSSGPVAERTSNLVEYLISGTSSYDSWSMNHCQMLQDCPGLSRTFSNFSPRRRKLRADRLESTGGGTEVQQKATAP
jgi:hypothetical protein